MRYYIYNYNFRYYLQVEVLENLLSIIVQNDLYHLMERHNHIKLKILKESVTLPFFTKHQCQKAVNHLTHQKKILIAIHEKPQYLIKVRVYLTNSKS